MICATQLANTDSLVKFLDSLTLQIINHYGLGKYII